GNAPIQARRRTGDAKVFKLVVLEEAEDFIATMIRLHKRRIRFNVINEPLLMRLEFEPEIALRKLHYLAVGRIKRPIRPAFFVSEECFFLRGIKPFISLLVEFSRGMKLGEDRLNKLLVPRTGRADEIVVGEFKLLREGLPIRGELIAISLRRFPFRL